MGEQINFKTCDTSRSLKISFLDSGRIAMTPCYDDENDKSGDLFFTKDQGIQIMKYLMDFWNISDIHVGQKVGV